MNTVIIRETTKPGVDPKMFRAYGVGNRALGVSASTTGNERYGVLRCAAKAFAKYGEASDLDEIETRIALTRKMAPTGEVRWEAHLQPKSPCDRTNPAGDCTWISTAIGLPDSDSIVLIACETDEPVWIGYHDGEMWRTADGAAVTVTHWMQLPAPPKV